MKTNKPDRQTATSRIMWFIMAAAAIFGLLLGTNARAAGLLIADGGFGGVLEIQQHDVHVSINNGVAVTRIDQVFRNTEKRQVEALYTFPVPKGASVANFSMWINGKEMIGEVLEKTRAREIYNSYKRKRKDPGLLEQVDYKTFEMRIYPINAGAQQRVQLTYYQELEMDHDQATYVYPLATVTRSDIDSRTTGKFAIDVEFKSAVPIVSIESPSHRDDFVVVPHTDRYGQASLESVSGSLAEDVVITYQLQRPHTGLDLITSRRSGEDGFFSMTLTAGQELASLGGGMDYVFLLDISGSMGNDGKLSISRNSLNAFVDQLSDADRFELMTFNVRPGTLFGQLQPAQDDFKETAREYLKSQQARGGTVLAPAITTAYKYGDPDRTLNVVILSDGMTEQKERQDLLQLIRERPRHARVFCIGIGNEVNRPLLEQLAEDTGGLAAFVSRGDDFNRQAKAFRRKLMHPAIADLAIAVEGVRVADLAPLALPNLYHGAPVRLYGRYSGSGDALVTVTGTVRGQEIKQTARMNFPKRDDANPEIERMWAWKRIDQLLKKADRSGSRAEVVDEVIQLGEAFSIVSEYTSFLVLENDNEYKRWKIDRRNALRIQRDRAAHKNRQDELDLIRGKAVADIGPQTLASNRIQSSEQAQPAVGPPPSPRTQSPAAQQPDPGQPRPKSQSRDFDFGTGPVGPVFMGLAWWLTRRKRKNNS